MSDLDFKTDFSSELATIITLLENIYIAQKRAGSNVANEPDFDKARAELAELREDRERLEWLAANIGTAAQDNGIWELYDTTGAFIDSGNNFDLRAAIDSARKASEENNNDDNNK